MNYLRNISKILILTLLLFGQSCNKGEDMLVLDQEYFTVSDITIYCTGSCDETSGWENKPALVKGYAKGVENDSLMQEFYNKELFYLEDIRTGLFMEIRITDDKDAIFNKLNSVRKTDMLYIKGIALPVVAYDGDDCTKGMVLSVDNTGAISIGDN
jgi:hypothetical protein